MVTAPAAPRPMRALSSVSMLVGRSTCTASQAAFSPRRSWSRGEMVQPHTVLEGHRMAFSICGRGGDGRRSSSTASDHPFPVGP